MVTTLLAIKNISSYHMELPLSEEDFKKYQYLLPNSLKTAAIGRQNEFIAGRICAIKAGKQIGFEVEDLKIGDSREPLWPNGLVGSITHTKGFAIAAVALKTHIRSIGIDIEKIISEKRIETIYKMVLTEDDKLMMKNVPSDMELLACSAIFSIKESLYKAIYPFCKCYFGFKEANINEINFDQQSVEIEIISERQEMKAYLGKYKAQFQIFNNMIISSIILK